MITLHYQSRFGLARAAVWYQGRAHLYVEGYENDAALSLMGVRSVARLKSKSGGMAFLTLADGGEAVLDAPQEIMVKLVEGVTVEVEIIAEARDGKRARANFIAIADGEPRRLSPVLSLKDRLLAQALACIGDQPVRFAGDDEALDVARDEACDPSGPLGNGGYLSVERTRGLIAGDVDTAEGGQGLTQTPRAFAKSCNELAVQDLPRRLRLSGLAGLVVVDLIGRKHDGDRMRDLLLTAFGAEASRIIVGPVGKFGTLEFVRPWGARPTGDLSPVNHALYSLWQAIRLSQQDRSRIIVIRSRPVVIDVLRPLLSQSLDPLAPMLRLEVSAHDEVVAL